MSGCKLLKGMAPHPPSLRNRWLAPGCEAAARPPVNSRIAVVLLLFAGSCRRLLERALLQRAQGLAHLPLGAGTCCELPRVVARKRQEKGKVVAGGSEVR